MLRMLFGVALFFLILFVILFFYTWYRLHKSLNFHAPNSATNLPSDLIPKTEFATNSEGQRIAYWYFPVANPRGVIILVHGYKNPGGKSLATGYVDFLRRAGYSTVLLDLRAHGESDGQKTTLGASEWMDVDSVYNKIRDLPENQNKKVGLLGVSMGAVTSIITASIDARIDFVIASVPYKSFDSLFETQIRQNRFPPQIFLPLMKLAALLEFPTDFQSNTPENIIHRVRTPILILAATRDKEVNPQDAKELFFLANKPKELYEIDSPHDIFYYEPEEFKLHVLQFLEKYTP